MRIKIILMYLGLGLAMVQYQNCAPSPQDLNGEAAVGADYDVIDQISVGQINFPQKVVTASMEEKVVVIGVCDQSGSLISWKLSDPSGEFIERGLAECDLGSFEVELSDQWQQFCDETLNLSAQLGVKASSEAQVQADCQ